MKRSLSFSIILGAIAILHPLHLSADTQDELMDWFNSDEELNSLAVNEGDLKFIAPIRNKAVLHLDHRLDVTETGLESGWINMRQCYKGLDPVSAIDIQYRYKRIKDLKIVSFENIEDASSNGHIISLKNVSRDAEICVKAQVNVFLKNDSDGYTLETGPFHRRFLDGYYPFHLSFSINFPGKLVKLTKIHPEPGLFNQYSALNNQVSLDTWFEGKLKLKLEFARTDNTK